MSLLAIKIIKKNRDFLLKAIEYNTQNGDVLGRLSFFQNNLNECDKALEELEQYQQTLKQKGFDCSNESKTHIEIDNTSHIYKIAGYESDGRE